MLAVEKQAQSLDEVLAATTTIENANQKIRKRAETCRKKLLAQVDQLNDAVAAIKASLSAESQ